MTLAIRKACTVGASLLTGFSSFVYYKASRLEPSQRGNLTSRTTEIVRAFFRAATIPILNQHVRLVSEISSRESTKDQFTEKEGRKIANSYSNGYLYMTTANTTADKTPTFRYTDLSYYLPQTTERSGFIFSGNIDHIHDSNSREQIILGNYVRCIRDLPLQNGDNFKKTDVIITGTKDFKKCDEFMREYFEDVVSVASKGVLIPPEHPFSNTLIFEIKANKYKEADNLSHITEVTKENIQAMNYTLCIFNATRHRSTVRAIVTGVNGGEEICKKLIDEHRKKITQLSKK